jgi:hypothetical protein
LQFNNRITVIYAALNDFGEEVPGDEKTMRCCIIEHNKRLKKDESGRSKRFDLKLIVSNRAYEPYRDLFDKGQLLQFRYNGTVYEPEMVAAINDFSGKIKYYEIELRESKG